MRFNGYDEAPYTVTYPADNELYRQATFLWDCEEFAGRVDLTYFTEEDNEFDIVYMEFSYWNAEDLDKIEKLVERAKNL